MVSCGNGREAGFTLLELLLVIVIVGIIASLAMPTLSTRSDGDLLKISVRTLLSVLELQEEEAILSGTQRGLFLFARPPADGDRFHYQWMIWSSVDGRWVGADAPEIDGSLEGADQLYLLIEEREVAVADGELLPGRGIDARGDERQPQILIFSSGEVSDFELNLETRDGRGGVVLRGGFDGFSMEAMDSEAEEN